MGVKYGMSSLNHNFLRYPMNRGEIDDALNDINVGALDTGVSVATKLACLIPYMAKNVALT